MGRSPDAKLFKASIDIFAVHGAIYPMNHRIFQGDIGIAPTAFEFLVETLQAEIR
jgi:hypothetical protein